MRRTPDRRAATASRAVLMEGRDPSADHADVSHAVRRVCYKPFSFPSFVSVMKSGSRRNGRKRFVDVHGVIRPTTRPMRKEARRLADESVTSLVAQYKASNAPTLQSLIVRRRRRRTCARGKSGLVFFVQLNLCLSNSCQKMVSIDCQGSLIEQRCG